MFETLDEEEEKEIGECLKQLDTLKEIPSEEEIIEELKKDEKAEEAKLELKILTLHLNYVFLELNGRKFVIINSSLSTLEEEKLIEILKDHKGAIGWSISNLKGIIPSYYMHKIIMEEDFKHVA